MLRISIILAILFTFFSCSNDFQLTENGKEIPVVYGLLSQADTAIYVRIEKTFLNEEIEPKILSQDPNNFYFDNIVVELTNIKTLKSYTLKKVDGNKEGYPRDNGVFAQSPNYLYKLHSNEIVGGKLGDNVEYELTVKLEDGSVLTKARTIVLRAMSEKDITSPGASASLAIDYSKDLNIGFRADPKAFIHDLFLYIYYTEEKNGNVEEKVIKWNMAKNFEANQPNNLNINFAINGRVFYEFLKSNLTEDQFVNRFLKSASIEIASGGLEIRDYVNIVQANLGITSSGEVPTYTNIENGIGLFSSRTRLIRENIPFTENTRDSIANGIITKNLNFR
jgi:hypothetical protein